MYRVIVWQIQIAEKGMRIFRCGIAQSHSFGNIRPLNFFVQFFCHEPLYIVLAITPPL